MDTNMEDAGPSNQGLKSDMDVNMGESSGPGPGLPCPGFVLRSPNVINLDDDDDGNDSDTTLLGDEYVERTVPSHESSGTIATEHIKDISEQQSYSSHGRTFKPGKTIETSGGTFLRIESILKDRETCEIILKGNRFQRTRTLGGRLESKRNEVAMILELDTNDPCNTERSTEVVELAAVVRIRELVLTNQQFPDLSYRETDTENVRKPKQYVENHCRLICRWVYLEVSKNEGFLKKIVDIESDDGCSIPRRQLRHNYRGLTVKGGACQGRSHTEEAIDLRERSRCFFIDPFGFHSRSTDIPRHPKQRVYTFGDGFCGGGGASRGAHGAGFHVAWGFDHDPHAITTYFANFPNARCEGIAANDFVIALNEEYKVDVLHLSPPCQTFSPAHTRPGPNDESNEATFLATDELIKKTKPRIVTLEETFGLTRTLDNLAWFNAMVQMFTKLGFSVRWKVFNLLEFGLPQPRRRLFLFASCPGETLPNFPDPTHCRAEDRPRFPHLSTFTTVNDAIGRIPRTFPDHSPHLMAKLTKTPYSSNLPLKNTITCAGSINYHPSGTRAFTVRELACLQGFPLEHRFGRGARVQIGNAVPPVVAKVFFEQVIRALRMADGL